MFIPVDPVPEPIPATPRGSVRGYKWPIPLPCPSTASAKCEGQPQLCDLLLQMGSRPTEGRFPAGAIAAAASPAYKPRGATGKLH